MQKSSKTDRESLLYALNWFLDEVKQFKEVRQVALIGSICTNKPNPKDIDLLISIKPKTDLKKLATLRRKTQGRIGQGLLGTDMFIVEDGRYLGRLCRYREPWPRVVCCNDNLICDRTRNYLCNTSNNFSIDKSIINNPPITIYPKFSTTIEIPNDVGKVLHPYISQTAKFP